MASSRVSLHGEWSSRFAFILAATGSAVGLGNVWKFPYITGENGGGVFVLVYLVCIAVIAIPIMISEVMLGRRGRQSPINTMRALARDEGLSRYWALLGWMGVVAGFLILSYYSVIAGWSMAYVFRAAGGLFQGLGAEGVDGVFTRLVSDPERLLAWHTLFMGSTMVMVARGVESGLETAVRYLMPALFGLLLLLVGYAVVQGDIRHGLEFMFRPEFARLTPDSVLVAMGQAFFTLSLGMGAIMIYGSYLPAGASIPRTVVMVAVFDTVAAILAGLAIFPIVFTNALEPASGPGLIFKTLPIAFGQMPGGAFFGALFFLLLVFAAWTSAISLIEPAVAWLVENHDYSRVHATVLCGSLTWLAGLGTIFSFNLAAGVTFLDMTYFDLLDYLTSNIMLPLGGMLIAIFAAWRMSAASVRDELALDEGAGYYLWRFLVRYIAPFGVGLVLLNVTGVFNPL